MIFRRSLLVPFAFVFAALLILSSAGCHSKIEGVRLELLSSITLNEESLSDSEDRAVELDRFELTVEMVELIGCGPGLAARILSPLSILGPSRARAYHGGPTTPTTYAHHTTVDLTLAGEAPFGHSADGESDSGFSPPANDYCAAFVRLGALNLIGSADGEGFDAALEHLRLDLSLELGELGTLDELEREAELLLEIDVNLLVKELDFGVLMENPSSAELFHEAIRRATSISWRNKPVEG